MIKFLPTILAAAVISYCVAAPVNPPPPVLEPTTSQTVSTDEDVPLYELMKWIQITNSPWETFYDQESILPSVKSALKTMQSPLESPNSAKAAEFMKALKCMENHLKDLPNYSEETKRIIRDLSFDDENGRQSILKGFDNAGLIRYFRLRKQYYERYHFPRDCEIYYMTLGRNYIKEQKKADMISNLYKTRKTSDETLFELFEGLKNNFHSIDQIDQFITMYDDYNELFLSMSMVRRKLQFKDTPVGETTSDGRNDGLTRNVPSSSTESNPALFAFPTAVSESTVAIQKQLKQWRNFVKMNQPINPDEVLSALEGCTDILKDIEAFSPAFSFDGNEGDKFALQIADELHDFLKDAVTLLLPSTYFTGLLNELPEDSWEKLQTKLWGRPVEETWHEIRENLLEKIVHGNPILPKEFFDDSIFIEFCLTYADLLLKKNCLKLNRKPDFMVKQEDFVNQNRPYLKLIKTYQPILELQSVDETPKREEDGILQDSRRRAVRTLKKNYESFFKGPLRSDQDLKEHWEVNAKYVNTLDLVDTVGKPWMEYHVPTLLDFQPIDIHVNSYGNLYIDYDPNDKRFESRRLSSPICRLGSDSGHIQSIHSN